MKAVLFWCKLYMTSFIIIALIVVLISKQHYTFDESILNFIIIASFGVVFSLLYAYMELSYIPKRKIRMNNFLNQNFKQLKSGIFEFQVNGYTGTFEFKQHLSFGNRPYTEWLYVLIAVPSDWPKERIEKIRFLWKNYKIDDVIYLTCDFNGPIKLNKIMKFLELQAQEINRRIG